MVRTPEATQTSGLLALFLSALLKSLGHAVSSGTRAPLSTYASGTKYINLSVARCPLLRVNMPSATAPDTVYSYPFLCTRARLCARTWSAPASASAYTRVSIYTDTHLCLHARSSLSGAIRTFPRDRPSPSVSLCLSANAKPCARMTVWGLRTSPHVHVYLHKLTSISTGAQLYHLWGYTSVPSCA